MNASLNKLIHGYKNFNFNDVRNMRQNIIRLLMLKDVFNLVDFHTHYIFILSNDRQQKSLYNIHSTLVY